MVKSSKGEQIFTSWTGLVYSPEVTWKQRQQIYQHALDTPDAGNEPSA